MNAILTLIGQTLRNTTARIALGAALSTAGFVSTAHAHGPDVDLRVDLRHGHVELERRHWVEPMYETRETRVWVEPVYNTVPGPRTWVEPVYRNVTERVWRESVTRDERVQVWVPATWQDREEIRGRHVHRERVLIPAHYDVQIQQVVVVPGHYEDVCRKELAADGHWQCADQQVCVTPGHWETRVERVCVRDGHWEDRPLIRLTR